MTDRFDSHQTYRKLVEEGSFPENQAGALVQLVNGAIAGNLATKSDIEKIESKLESLENRLKLWMFKSSAFVIGLVVLLTEALDYIIGLMTTL